MKKCYKKPREKYSKMLLELESKLKKDSKPIITTKPKRTSITMIDLDTEEFQENEQAATIAAAQLPKKGKSCKKKSTQ